MPMAISNNAVTAATLDGVPHVFSFSGIDSTKIFSGISLKSFRYNTQTDSWDTIAPLPDTRGKIAAGASTVKNKIYIIGGYYVFQNGSETSSDDVHIYDPQTNQYLADGATIPVPIDDHVQVVYRDSLIYVITGWSNTTNRNTVQIYNPAMDSWSVGTAMPNTNTYKSFGASGAIVGDNIFYFGGAASIGNFPIQNVLRMGIIDKNDPTQISWSDTVVDAAIFGYRMAATAVNGKLHWIGGSNQTYNYNGKAYSNSQGVPPNNRNLVLLPTAMKFVSDTSQGTAYPMDLRGIAETSSTTRYLAGGMEANQKVSRKMLKLEYVVGPIHIEETEPVSFRLYPNPARDFVYLDVNEEIDESVKLLSIDGQLKRTLKLQQNRLDLRDVANGFYTLRFTGKGKSYSQKIEIKR